MIILFLTNLFVLSAIGCLLEVLTYKDCGYFNLIEFLVFLVIGLFCLITIIYLLNI